MLKKIFMRIAQSVLWRAAATPYSASLFSCFFRPEIFQRVRLWTFNPNEWVVSRFRISVLVKLAVEAMAQLLLQRQREEPKGGEGHA
jgi:hypothetical protein